MNWTEDLKRKINDRSVVVGIIGLGYVGLPLAVAFSRKYEVVGFDKNEDKIKLLEENKSYIEDIQDSEINLEKLHPTTSYEELTRCDFIIITVPTPLRADKSPDLSYIEMAGKSIGEMLKRGQFIILKSTTFPGTTEEYLIPILEEKSGLKSIKDFGVAYSPERVDPGNKKYKIENTPNVVGGLTPEFTEICAMLYEDITEKIVKVQDCKTAEAVKMIENIFRNVNIALVNELALIFDKMDIDIWEAIDAAKTKPYGFMPFYPGPGVGGHCIPLDPYYLSYRAKQFGIIPRFIETAGEINDFMPIHTVNLAKRGLKRMGKPIRGSKILILGLAYKGNISDTRESPAANVIEELKERGAELKVHDPYAKCIKTRFGHFYSEDLKESIKWAECAIIVTNHQDYIKLKYLEDKYDQGNILIIDSRNIFQQNREMNLENFYNL
ncbi:nucleotide sugar dehydrogenase [Methanobacterium formicicum]|uniref:UDP-N-acetyl-D-mannosamine dehydrogenase n=1 Tax=Methanobacterium formicicum TaxID=2162 RepID=A0A090I139_METFO|nr:nucleotide sugar dehydrogenase [Methanobacterium formicicum]MDH2659131.1 nucleotide sugar dehydrogenase [Methanobacterium formicicum]CEA12608.1 VI polysaccharide biosynthesis protein [Methanobacterium formicicum]